MKAISSIEDLEDFVILHDRGAKALITPALNETLGKAFFPKNLHATSEEIGLTYKVYKIMDLMLEKGITVEVANGQDRKR